MPKKVGCVVNLAKKKSDTIMIQIAEWGWGYSW